MIPVSQTTLLVLVFALVIGWAVALQLWGSLRQAKKRNEDLLEGISRYDYLLGLVGGSGKRRIDELHKYSYEIRDYKFPGLAHELARMFQEELQEVERLQTTIASSENAQELITLRKNSAEYKERAENAERKLEEIRRTL